MQDQGKRLLIAVALALGVLFAWNAIFHKEEPPPPDKAGSAEAQKAEPAGTAAANPVAKPVEEQPRPPEVPITLQYPNFEATFSSYCGGLKSWKLTDARYARDATQGRLLPEKSQLTTSDAKGNSIPVPPEQMVHVPDCGAFDVNFALSTFVVPHNAVWKGEQRGPNEVVYTYSNDQLDLVKTFTVFPDKYLVRMAIKVGVRVPEGTEARQQLVVSVYSYQDPAKVKGGSTRVAPRVWASSTMREGSVVETDVVSLIETRRYEPAIQWTGFEHPYLLVGYAPRLAEGERVEKHTSATNDGQPHGFMWTYLQFPQTTFKHGDAPMTREVVGYLGPKNYDDLEQADAAAGFSTGFNKVVDLGWFAFIGRPLLWLLLKFHEGVGNWGIAIILLTFVVKVLTLYWTTKSMRSMKAMAALAPQMKALQEKYGDDKQRQQAETMALYKQHGVNPVAGCLPMLLQMPVWIALYRMLANAGELYRQPFIPVWIGDLTATDPYYVLPAILFITMFLQTRLQPATGDSTQQKLMQYGMPIMFGAMAFFFPSGLTLYMLTNNVLSALHSIYMNKFDKQSLAIAAQLKKNQGAVAAAAAAAAKAGTQGGQGSKKAGGQGAKRVIDAQATEERAAGEGSGDGDETDDAPGTAAAPGSAAARNRPRRKKRRR